MRHFGFSEYRQGDLVAARQWYTQAVATDHPDEAPRAMVNLGALEHGQGNLVAARQWWTRAVATDHPDQAPRAMFNLGVLEYEQGDLVTVRQWWTRAASSNHAEMAPEAAEELGRLERDHGDIAAARHWLAKAAGSGHMRAAVTLANLEYHKHRFDEARRWYEHAIDSDSDGIAQEAREGLDRLRRDEADQTADTSTSEDLVEKRTNTAKITDEPPA
jgi:TPR repeat protein